MARPKGVGQVPGAVPKEAGAYKPGHRNGGRPPGVGNRLTRDIKLVFMQAFENSGGVAELSKWAMENRTEFYKLYARLIPIKINASIRKEQAEMTDAELEQFILERRRARLSREGGRDGSRVIEGETVSASKSH